MFPNYILSFFPLEEEVVGARVHAHSWADSLVLRMCTRGQQTPRTFCQQENSGGDYKLAAFQGQSDATQVPLSPANELIRERLGDAPLPSPN